MALVELALRPRCFPIFFSSVDLELGCDISLIKYFHASKLFRLVEQRGGRKPNHEKQKIDFHGTERPRAKLLNEFFFLDLADFSFSKPVM